MPTPHGAAMMASIILAAGTFLGILKGAGMLDAISKDLVHILPDALLPYLHIAIGVLGIPLELVLSTDAYYFGLFPIVEQITSQAGVAPEAAGYAMLIGSIVGTFVTPLSLLCGWVWVWRNCRWANTSVIRFSGRGVCRWRY